MVVQTPPDRLLNVLTYVLIVRIQSTYMKEASYSYRVAETNNWGGGKPSVSWNMLQCNSGTFCCRDHKSTENCCGNSTALIHTRVGKLQIPTGATATVFATATVTSSSQSSNGSVQASCPKDNTVVVGGAVGGALGAALLASLVAVAVLYRRRADGYKKSVRKELSESSVDIKDYYGSSVSICQNCTKPAELSAKAPVHELQ